MLVSLPNPNAAADVVRDLLAYSASVRWATEQGGIQCSNGMAIRTDSEAQRKIGQLRLRVERDELPSPFAYKAATGWVQIDRPNLDIIDTEMASHVRRCYEAERQLFDMIVSGLVTSEAEIDPYYRTFCFEPVDAPIVIDRLEPDTALRGDPFVVRVIGQNFCGLGTIVFNGLPLVTYLISAGELRGFVERIPQQDGPVPVKVQHPAPAKSSPAEQGGIESNEVIFTFGPPKPAPPAPPPVVSGLQPNTVRRDKTWAAAVNGSFFAAGAEVLVGGSAVVTTFVNASQVTVAVAKDMFQTVGAVFPVTVRNPDGQTSNAMNLTVIAA